MIYIKCRRQKLTYVKNTLFKVLWNKNIETTFATRTRYNDIITILTHHKE